ncbi:MAG TPA: cupin domain-containing protein [Terriglobales bacterium]|nr:cupin domain-containing protein [Terriglobales bacterium]
MSEVFRISDQLARVSDTRRYLEFLRVPAMSAGVYVLQVGEIDGQKPHDEDEIYYVIRGRAKMKLGREEREVRAGGVIFVEKALEHKFFDIAEELVLLVVFAPAESG